MPDQSKLHKHSDTGPASKPVANEVGNEREAREARVAQKIWDAVERLRRKRVSPDWDSRGADVGRWAP
jgi:hypothetical protein